MKACSNVLQRTPYYYRALGMVRSGLKTNNEPHVSTKYTVTKETCEPWSNGTAVLVIWYRCGPLFFRGSFPRGKKTLHPIVPLPPAPIPPLPPNFWEREREKDVIKDGAVASGQIKSNHLGLCRYKEVPRVE